MRLKNLHYYMFLEASHIVANGNTGHVYAFSSQDSCGLYSQPGISCTVFTRAG